MNGRSKIPSVLILLGNTVLTGVLVSVVANIISTGVGWEVIVIRLGWWNLLLVAWLLLLVFSIRRSDVERTEAEKFKSLISQKFQDLVVQVVKSLFELSVKTIMYPEETRGFNIHLFLREDRQGTVVLVKKPDFSFEPIPLPGLHTLDYADPSADHLVICDAYNKNCTKYEKLPQNHTDRYNERIQDKVDAKLKWVMGASLQVDNTKPLGVICCFGRELFFKDEVQLAQFEVLLQNLSAIVVRLLGFENAINGEELEE